MTRIRLVRSYPLFFILQSKMCLVGKLCFPSPSGSSGSPLQSSVRLSSLSSFSVSLTLSKVSQRPGSSSSHMPPQLGHTGPPFSTASRSLSLRLFSPLVRAYSLSSLSLLDSPLARHDMEDESVPYAPLVLYRTDRHHRSMLPHSHRHMRMLYLGIVSDRL
jgi:hypothetical protein